MKLGARMRELRKSIGETQAVFGARYGLEKSTISGYESGAREPTFELVQRIAEEFGVTMDWLVGRSDKKHWGRDITDGLTDEERKTLEEHAEFLRNRHTQAG